MPLPRFVTRAKMLWDDENLYVAAVLDGDEIWGHPDRARLRHFPRQRF